MNIKNLTNLPSGSKFGKLIKACFKAPNGKFFVSADYDSLEDKGSTLKTRDPNKLKVYTDGYDSHCLRAFHYFGNEMQNISETAESVNSIKQKYPKLRQKSKAPTFALTYDGTWVTLHKNIGLPIVEAKAIEANYHKLYKVSDQVMFEYLKQASIDGYVTGAYGHKLYTPIIKQCIWDSPSVPHVAMSESKTAGNMIIQSYGLLNSNTANLFMDRVYKSKYRYTITPVAQIHDANYLYIPATLEALEWTNNNLTECMALHGCPELEHETIKISGELDLHFENWSNAITLTRGKAVNDIKDINDILKRHIC